MLQRKSAANLGKTLRKNKLLLFLTFLALFFGLIWQLKSEASDESQEKEITDLVYIQRNSLVAISEPFYITPRDMAIELLLDEITKRESGGDPKICNLEYGCSSGQGLTGVIPSTERICEKAFERELDMFNPEDNLACARWLLDTQGIWPWQPYSGDYTSVLLELDLYEEMFLNPGSKVEIN